MTGHYRDTPQRLRAREAPALPTPVLLATARRWGTAWYWPDAKHEGVRPVDDSDMGCDCPVKCTIRHAWTRQIATIDIDPSDAITDDGQEAKEGVGSRDASGSVHRPIEVESRS